jgi:hypothetical protein
MDGQVLLFVRDRVFGEGLEGVVAGGIGHVHGQMGQREREEEFAPGASSPPISRRGESISRRSGRS